MGGVGSSEPSDLSAKRRNKITKEREGATPL